MFQPDEAWAASQAGISRSLMAHGFRMSQRSAGSKSTEIAALKYIIRNFKGPISANFISMQPRTLDYVSLN